MRLLPEPVARPVGREVRRTPVAGRRLAMVPVHVVPGGRVVLAVVTASLAWLGNAAAHASTFQWFTDQTAFIAALESGYYTATGSDLSSGGGEVGTNETTFSGGAEPYGFTVSATGGLYGIPDGGGISALEPFTPLAFLAFTPANQVQAFGGLFSLMDALDARAPGSISLSVFTGVGGTTLISGTTVSIPVAATFLGLVSYDVPITGVTFDALFVTGTSLYTAAETITVGVPVAPVPEPSTLAAAGMGALVLGIAYRRRRRAARARAVAELET
jgi:hypothetical protein